MDITLILVALGVLAALAVGVFLYLRGQGEKEELTYHFRCPKCHRRLRYQARQAGHKGQCSNCGNEVTFPHSSQSID
jgi:transcription initiation factor IIE alpha subunit